MASIDTTSTRAETETANKQETKDIQNSNNSTINQPPPNPPFNAMPGWTVECNSMEFVDSHGVKHKIYLPKGTMKRACQLFADENWDELVKFPVYGECNLVLIPLYQIVTGGFTGFLSNSLTNLDGQQYNEGDWIREEDGPSNESSEVKS